MTRLWSMASRVLWCTEEVMVHSMTVRYLDPVAAKQAPIITSLLPCLTVGRRFFC